MWFFLAAKQPWIIGKGTLPYRYKNDLRQKGNSLTLLIVTFLRKYFGIVTNFMEFFFPNPPKLWQILEKKLRL